MFAAKRYHFPVDTQDEARYNKAVADILREKKDELGLSFDTLAAATGLGRATVARLMYGQRELKVYALRRLASVLELDVGEVLDRAESSL